MTQVVTVSRRDVENALKRLDSLSQEEYEQPLEVVLHDPNRALAAQRLARLAGIVLKQPFAEPTKSPSNFTGAKRGWEWKDVSKWPEGAERTLLEQLREPGPWNEIWDRERNERIQRIAPWSWFTEDVDHERGLFKVVALYVKDRLNGEQRKAFAEYYRMNEGPRLRRGLDLATAVFDSTILAPVLGITGIPALAVSISLIAIEYGYEKLTEPEDVPDEV